ncbi:MAG: cell surface protein [Myxococcaceae bacterium]|nr:cell surface protein [Myxococcaceae bacterium]
MTLRLVSACALLWSGCTCGIALCRVDGDCAGAGTCDPSTGVCISTAGSGGGSGGGSTAALRIRVPALPDRPAVSGAVYEDVPAARRRDEVVFIWLEASRPLTGPALTVAGLDAVPAGAAACDQPCSGNCYCFAADLAKPPLPGLRGAFALAASGVDPDGKTITATDSINVTRLLWRRGLALPIRATPAIGPDGTVYVGTSGGPSSRQGSLFAISPTGQERWSTPLGSIEASVALSAPGTAPQALFVGSIGATGLLTALDASGAQLAQCTLAKDARLEGSAALIPLGAAFYASEPRELIAFRPSLSSPCAVRATSDDLKYPDSLVASSDSVFFVDDHPSVHRYDLTGLGWSEYDQSEWPGSPGSSYRNRGLAIVNGGRLVGAGALDSGGTVFQSVVSGSFKFDFGFSPPRVPASASGPVVASDGLVLVGIPTGIAAVSTDSTNLGAGDRIVNSPVLGEGGRLYALAENGALSEWRYAGGQPVRSWTAPLEAAGPPVFEASPALDCARSPSGAPAAGRPGILYAGARTGTLWAILVDARGIDSTAQWPKYQKDPRNSGRADTALQEFACP